MLIKNKKYTIVFLSCIVIYFYLHVFSHKKHEKTWKKHGKNMDFRLKKYYIIFLYSKYEKIQLLIVRLSYQPER